MAGRHGLANGGGGTGGERVSGTIRSGKRSDVSVAQLLDNSDNGLRESAHVKNSSPV
jgi:hypothetical protein